MTMGRLTGSVLAGAALLSGAQVALAAPAAAPSTVAAPAVTAAPAAATAAVPAPVPPPALDTTVAKPPALTVVSPPPPTVYVVATPAMPANSVRCVYDNLSTEDREITMMLIALDSINRGKYSRIAPQNRIVDRLVQEALPRCAQAYRWSAAASAAAVDYAHAALVQEVVRQALDLENRKVDPIESYYAGNRALLAGKAELDELMEEGFTDHLRKAGWKEVDRAPRRLARVYLELLIARDRSEQVFAKAAAPQRPAKRPVRRARTASRGRP